MGFWSTRINNMFARQILSLSLAFSVFAPGVLANTQTNQQITEPVIYEEQGAISQDLGMPIYHWRNNAISHPRGIILAVHGLVMHGRSFGAVGQTLAGQGFEVFATDLRGYGRVSCDTKHEYCIDKTDCKQRIDYEKSFADLVTLAKHLRQEHPDVPLYAVGESLGGSMVIRLAAQRGELVDGIILSAPAIKRHSFIDPYLLSNAGLMMANPLMQLDLLPFVRKYASDDPVIVEELVNDPLMRKHMNACELLKSNLAVRKTASFISKIKPTTPVLVIQGSADRCVKANAVVLLLSQLRSQDQTVKWFHQRGHILLETAHVKPDTMDTVVGWLNDHAHGYELQARDKNCDHKDDPSAAYVAVHGTLYKELP